MWSTVVTQRALLKTEFRGVRETFVVNLFAGARLDLLVSVPAEERAAAARNFKARLTVFAPGRAGSNELGRGIAFEVEAVPKGDDTVLREDAVKRQGLLHVLDLVREAGVASDKHSLARERRKFAQGSEDDEAAAKRDMVVCLRKAREELNEYRRSIDVNVVCTAYQRAIANDLKDFDRYEKFSGMDELVLETALRKVGKPPGCFFDMLWTEELLRNWGRHEAASLRSFHGAQFPGKTLSAALEHYKTATMAARQFAGWKQFAEKRLTASPDQIAEMRAVIEGEDDDARLAMGVMKQVALGTSFAEV